MTAPVLPLDTLREAAPELRRPFETKAVKWKVQTAFGGSETMPPTGGIVIAYMDRGLVIDRLNMVVPHLWSPQFSALERNHMLCQLTIDSVTREDVGEGGTLKARYSDALKRASVHFGVGVSLSRIPRSRLFVDKAMLSSYQKRSGGFGLDLTEAGLSYLRNRYDEWLEKVGVDAYGEPLKHGDLGEAQGDEEAVESDAIIDQSAAVDFYVVLSETGLTLRQQVGLLNQVGADIAPTADAKEIAAVIGTLTSDQAAQLDGLIAARMEGGTHG